MRKGVGLLGAAVLAAALAAPAGAAGKPSIRIVGTSAKGGIVTVKVKIAGWKMYPARVGKKTISRDGGHWHIFVDGKYNSLSASRTSGQTLALPPGPHRVYVELANNDHSLLRPPARSAAVSMTLEEPKAAGTTGPPATGTTGGGTAPTTTGEAGEGGYGY